MTKIGYAILTWNSEKVIGPCIDSILKINSFASDIVVVDNGSTDNTLPILEAFSAAAPNSLKIIKNPANLGTTVPRNTALKELQSHGDVDYYCILDSDTVINDDAAAKLVSFLENNKDCGIVGPKMTDAAGTAQMSARRFPTLFEKLCKASPIKSMQKAGEKKEAVVPDNEAKGHYETDYLMSACWFIAPQVLETVGFLDEKIFYAPEDAEYCIRVWKSGYKAVYLPEAQIIHHWQRLSKKKLLSRINLLHIKGLFYMFGKHRYMFGTKRLKKSFQQNKPTQG